LTEQDIGLSGLSPNKKPDALACRRHFGKIVIRGAWSAMRVFARRSSGWRSVAGVRVDACQSVHL